MTQIRTGALLSYVSLFVNVLIGLLYTPWMIKSIGKADYGLYTLAMSVIALFVMDFGLGSAVTRFVAKYVAEGKQENANRFLAVVYKLYIFLDVLILLGTIILFFFLPSIYKGLSSDEIEKFKVVYCIAASFSIISFPFIPLNGILSAYEKFIQLKLCDLTNKLIIVSLMSLSLLMGYGLYALVIVNVIAGISIICFKLIFIRKFTPVNIEWSFWNRQVVKDVMSYSGWITVEKLSQRCIFALAPTILGILSNSKEIAVFGIAISLEGYAYSFSTAIGNMFLPRISRFLANGCKDEILTLMIRVGRIQVVIVCALLIVYIVLGREFIILWLGDGFDQLYICSLLLILPGFIHTPQQIGIDAIVAMNLVGKQARFYLLMAVVNLVLAIPLTKLFGVYGLSFSIFIAYLVRTLGNNIIFYKDMHLNILLFFRKVYNLRMISIIVLFLMSSILLMPYFDNLGWTFFLVKALAVFCFYFFLVYFIFLNEGEKNLIKSYFKS